MVEIALAEDLPPVVRDALAVAPDGATDDLSIEGAYARYPDRFSPTKPYFVGQSHLDLSGSDPSQARFVWSEDDVARFHSLGFFFW